LYGTGPVVVYYEHSKNKIFGIVKAEISWSYGQLYHYKEPSHAVTYLVSLLLPLFPPHFLLPTRQEYS
jgi:hypothetical protein